MINRVRHYRPLPDFLTIKESGIEGLGLFTNEKINSQIDLGVSHIYHIDFKDNYIRTPLGGFINHSENPNCEVRVNASGLNLFTIKPISPGEELTLKYNLYDPTE